LEVPVYNLAGEVVGQAELDEGVFGEPMNLGLVHQAVVRHLASQRVGTANTLTRSQVRGGGKKPWRQKGTGRARIGHRTAPHWRGGGVVFGPHPRDYRLGIPKKVRQLAKKSALNARAREGALLVVDPLAYEKPKTKSLVELLGKLGVAERKVLVLTAGAAQSYNVYLAGRNVPNVQVMRFADATAYEIVWSDAVVVELPALGEAAESADSVEASDA